MSSIGSDTLRLLTAQDSSALLSAQCLLPLYTVADQLAPVMRGGLECRLSTDNPQIDLQHCITANPDAMRLLQAQCAELLQQLDTLSAARPAWQTLHHFITVYLTGNLPLAPHLSELWLEYDADRLQIPSPLIFLGLPQQATMPNDLYSAVVNALNLLLPTGTQQPWHDNLRYCFSACPSSMFVSHLGLLPTRDTPAVRVNLKRFSGVTLDAYLQQLSWRYDTFALCQLLDKLLTMVDRVTVCLDIGQTISPQVGLECILLRQPANEPRWITFIDFLIDNALCTTLKANDLLDWPRQVTPMNTQTAWPETLMLASFTQPYACFSLFERRLSHIKLTWHPDKPLIAKGYLWFEHQWRQLQKSVI